MIAAISRGGSAAGLGRYLHGPGKANEHSYAGRPGGAVIAGTVGQLGPTDGKSWAKEFHRVASRGSAQVRRPVWHCSLRAATGDRSMTDAEWRSIAEEFTEALGIEALPWVAVRHGDDHVHLAVCRVGYDGAVWKGSHDRRAAQAACTAIEQTHHLEPAPRQRSQGRRGPASQVRAGEHAKAARTGQTPQRVVLAEKVIAVVRATAGKGTAAFEAECTKRRITATPNIASTGRMSGYSFADNTVAEADRLPFKASQLHKCLAWNQLAPVLTNPSSTAPPGDNPYVDANRRISGYAEAWQSRTAGRPGRRPRQPAVVQGPIRARVALPDGLGEDVDQAAAAARAAFSAGAAHGRNAAPAPASRHRPVGEDRRPPPPRR